VLGERGRVDHRPGIVRPNPGEDLAYAEGSVTLWWTVPVIAALVAWALVRTLRKPAVARGQLAPAKPAPAVRPAPVAATSPRAEAPSAPKPTPPAPDPAPAPPVPRKPPPPPIEEDDEAEFTLVTALPPSLRRPSLSAGPPSEPPASRPAKVEVIYEDEADVDDVGYPAARILLSASGESDGGRVRRRNEDSFLVVQERSLFVVADGMGGYAGGDVASALAVDTVAGAFERDTFEGKTEAADNVPRRGREMACAIQMANQAILDRVAKQPDLAQMGTTLVAARFSPNKQRVYIGHVGDSRCYRLRGGAMKQLTTDHTFLGLGLTGTGSDHLYQALGVDRRITIDIVVDRPRSGDLYLLCTDGLTKMATDDQIRDIVLAEPDLESAVYGLIELANDRGGKDNVTVILVKVLERRPSSAHMKAAEPAPG
jgi:serine/threonine protein phosphatase PrpC